MEYTLDGITVHAKMTSSGIGYLEHGEGSHLIVYLPGIGERGDGSFNNLVRMLNQGPMARSGWEVYTWRTPEIFDYPIRKVYPQLPASMGSWTIEYINSFLDEIYKGEVLCLAGWSLGGGGVCRYINQVNPKYDVKLAIALASATSEVGTNVKCKYWFAHAADDHVPVSNTDKFVGGIPGFDSSRYKRSPQGGHWWPLNAVFVPSQSINVYEELLAIPATPPEIQDLPVDTFFLRVTGDTRQLIAKVGAEEIVVSVLP